MNNDIINNEFSEKEVSFDFKKELGYYLFFWPWFLIFTLGFLFSAFFYLRYEERVYEANAQIQIKTDSDPTSFLMSQSNFFDYSRPSLQNEIAVTTSQHILTEVVKRINLQTKTYTFGSIVGSIKSNLLFENSLPIEVVFKEPKNNKILLFEVDDNILTINDGTLSYSLTQGQVLDLKDVYIEPKDSLFLENKDFKIIHSTINNAVAELRANLNVQAAAKQGEVINISYKGPNRDRNEYILNTLIQVLADDQVTDKQEISKVSISFIEERLEGLAESIDTISKNTIAFQMDNGIYDPTIQTNNAINKIVQSQEEVFSLEIQLEITKSLLKKLEASSNFDILPANIGIENFDINQLINSYNILVSQRNNLLISTTEQSPVVLQLSSQLLNDKMAVVSGLKNNIDGLELSLRRYNQMESKTKDRIAELPNKKNSLNTYMRSFKIVEELYVFLLQRKEEASISYISALPNLKILSYGVSRNSPISPKVQITYLVALLLGLFLPFGVLYLLQMLDTKINTRDDLEKGLQGISILGEVPFDENLKKSQNDIRGITAESTRVLRSSMSFLLKKETGNIITVTSTTKGEGKSFVSYNLAASYKALGKKVILVGADLRNPQIHNRLGIKRGSKGLSTFLADTNVTDLDHLITKASNSKQIDLLLSGAIPPNPSELLMRPRMKELLERLKEQYDVILIDSAPLLLVSDTTALLPLSDLVVYVSRAQYSDKNIFPFIKELQNRPNIPSFGMVLNGLIAGPRSGYNYKYGYRYSYRYRYRYSYSYKYNYGYGYGYGADKDS